MDPKDDKDNAIIDDTDAVVEEETARVVDKIAERQLCRKFDVRLMPVLAIMCEYHVWSLFTDCANHCADLFNALDKGNLANAQTNHLSDSTRCLTSNSPRARLT